MRGPPPDPLYGEDVYPSKSWVEEGGFDAEKRAGDAIMGALRSIADNERLGHLMRIRDHRYRCSGDGIQGLVAYLAEYLRRSFAGFDDPPRKEKTSAEAVKHRAVVRAALAGVTAAQGMRSSILLHLNNDVCDGDDKGETNGIMLNLLHAFSTAEWFLGRPAREMPESTSPMYSLVDRLDGMASEDDAFVIQMAVATAVHLGARWPESGTTFGTLRSTEPWEVLVAEAVVVLAFTKSSTDARTFAGRYDAAVTTGESPAVLFEDLLGLSSSRPDWWTGTHKTKAAVLRKLMR